MVNIFGSGGDDEEEAEYVCKSCGEEWEEEATAFYVDGRCVNCGASGSSNKIIKERDNPFFRDGSDDE